MKELKFKVLNSINKYKLFKKNDRIIISFSGGPDSVALVTLLRMLGYKHIHLVYFNHNIRDEKTIKKEVKFIKTFAKKNNLTITIKKIPVEFCAKKYKTSIEAAGHILRKELLYHLAKLRKYTVICTAHHHNDLIESLFIQLHKGSIYHLGLPIISKKGNIKFVRPLLFEKKETLLTYCKYQDQTYSIDNTNKNTSIQRNYVRHKIIPVLEKFDSNIAYHLLSLFKQNQSIHKEIQIEFIKEKFILIELDTHIEIDLSKLTKFSKLKQTSMIYQLLKSIHFYCHPQKSIKQKFSKKFTCRKETIESIHQHIINNNKQQLNVNQNLEIYLQNNKAIILKNNNIINKELSIKLNTPTNAFGYKITLTKCNQKEKSFKSSKTHCYLHLKEQEITVRKLSKTDSYIPFGRKSKQNIYSYLSSLKIPYCLKQTFIIFETNKNPIWVPGLPINKTYSCDENHNKIFKLELLSLTKPVTHVISYIL